MGIFGKNKETVTPVKTPVTFADQLATIKETFKTAYTKADTLNKKIEEDIQAKNAAIEALQVKLAESEEIEVTLIGLCTDICVVSNAMLIKAALPEIEVSVVADACAGVTPETHAAALTTMKMCQINII